MAKKCSWRMAGFFVAVIILSGCIKNQECPAAYSKGWVTEVNGPDLGYVNQDIPLKVSFMLSDPCWKFEKFEETADAGANTTTIQVISKNPASCLVCPQVIVNSQAIYNFRADQPGTYYLKFWKGENAYVTDTVTVVQK